MNCQEFCAKMVNIVDVAEAVHLHFLSGYDSILFAYHRDTDQQSSTATKRLAGRQKII